MTQDKTPDLPPPFDFDPAASKQQALYDMMRYAIMKALQPDDEVCEEDTFRDVHPPIVCGALAGMIAVFLSWLALSMDKGEDQDDVYEEFLEKLREYWNGHSRSPSVH